MSEQSRFHLLEPHELEENQQGRWTKQDLHYTPTTSSGPQL